MDVGVIVMSSEQVAQYFDKLERNLIEKLTSQQGLPIKTGNITNVSEGLGGQAAYLSEGDVMKLFSINSKQYFHRFRRAINLPCCRIGKNYVYLADEVNEFIRNKSTTNLMQPGKRKKRV